MSEVQTVCLRLWQSPDSQVLLPDKGVQGVLEDELGEALDAFAPDLRAATIALLSQMVTSAGPQRISADDLRQRVREDDQIAPGLLGQWRLPITMPGSGHGEKCVVIGLHWTRGATHE